MSFRFNVCIFAAVSTPGQAAQDKTSLGTQLEQCREWCAKGGHNVVAEIVVPGHSRSYYSLDQLAHDCDEYARMLDLARQRQFNLLLCPIFDRLWRTPVLEAQVNYFLKAHGIQAQSLQMPVPLLPPDQVTTDADPGDLIRMISGYLARVDTQTRLWRQVEAHRKRVTDRGLHWGGRRLFGWRRESPKSPMVPVEEEIRWYLTMMHWAEEGVSFREMARRLHEAGVQGSFGGPMTYSAIKRIVTNPFYAGGVRLAKWEKDPVSGKKRKVAEETSWDIGLQEPVISRARWERIQIAIEKKWSARPQTRKYPDVWSLRGLVRCGLCGYAMSRNWHRLYFQLRCSMHSDLVFKGIPKCRNRVYMLHLVEREVIEETKRLLCNPREYAQAKEAARQTQEQVSIEMLMLQLEAIDQRIVRVNRAIMMTDTLESLVKSLAELEQVKEQLTQRIQNVQAQQREWGEFERNALALQNVLDQLESGDQELLHKVFNRLYAGIYLHPEGIRYELLA